VKTVKMCPAYAQRPATLVGIPDLFAMDARKTLGKNH
jgi:hypothetical protein